MLNIYKSKEDGFGALEIISDFEPGAWINVVNPSEDEIIRISQSLGVDIEDLKAALDEEETARIEYEDNYTLIVVDVPIIDDSVDPNYYTTIPMAIILTDENVVTVTLDEVSVLDGFIKNKVKTFFTYKKSRFILQILFKISTRYLQCLKLINKESIRIENELHISMKNKELIQLLSLEKSLVYFSTSLKSNEIVLEKMLRAEFVRQFPEDTDLLEDVIIENKQAMEMSKIYSDILSGTMDAFASIISNNLNIVMKLLAVITIIFSVPNIVFSFFGMNVKIPFGPEVTAYGGLIAFGIAAVFCIITALFMWRKDMF